MANHNHYRNLRQYPQSYCHPKTEDSSTTSKFLTSLAVADTMSLIARGAQMVFTLGKMFLSNQYLTWKLSTTAFFGLSLLPERISKGVTVAIVCDRVVALTLPFRYKVVCRPMRITTIIVMVYIVIASFTIPDIVEFFVYHFNSDENRTIYTDMGKQYVATEVSQSPWKHMYLMFNYLVFDSLPIPVVFVCNIIIHLAPKQRYSGINN